MYTWTDNPCTNQENKITMHAKVLDEPLLSQCKPGQLPWYALVCSHLYNMGSFLTYMNQHKIHRYTSPVMASQTSPTDITDVIFGTRSQSVYAENNRINHVQHLHVFGCIGLDAV